MDVSGLKFEIGPEGELAFKSFPGNVDQPRNGPWPETRIVRPVSLFPRNQEMQSLVDFMGRRNYGKGRARSVGSMACTFVNAQEMGQMLRAKYPKVYENRKRTIQLQRRMAKNYEAFVKSNGRATDEIALEGFHFDFGDDEFSDETNNASVADFDEMTWHAGEFCVSGIGVFGKSIGLDIGCNPALQTELEDTMDFLRDEQLDTDYVDQNRRLHLSVFDPFARGVKLTGIQPPTMVSMETPRMWVNSNEVSY